VSERWETRDLERSRKVIMGSMCDASDAAVLPISLLLVLL